MSFAAGTETLQEQFIRSNGQWVEVGGLLVCQSFLLDITAGQFTLHFLRGDRATHGIRAKARDGSIALSEGSEAQAVDTWFQPELPDQVTHRFHSRGGIRFWNVYRVNHPDGTSTIDMWTGNAGMVLLESARQCHVYGCSRGTGDFDPANLVIEISWQVDGA